ncbi:MAG: rod shape-determining protein MreD [Bacteroidales bacterium]|nr:rod shape-determining protein MreD [Bacteroidales bacterium]
MSKNGINLIILFLILIITQVIICNNICLFNVAVPIIFIYLIIRLPMTLNINYVLTISFIMGLIIDIFSNTQGMHALSCTIIAFVRKPLLKLYIPREEDITDGDVSIKSIGFASYFKYLLSIILIYCTCVFVVESFSLFNIYRLITQIISSSVISLIIILGIDRISNKQREKGL